MACFRLLHVMWCDVMVITYLLHLKPTSFSSRFHHTLSFLDNQTEWFNGLLAGLSLAHRFFAMGVVGSHSVTCHSAAVTFPPLPQQKLILDLATPERYKAEFTWVVVISQDSLPSNTVTYLRNNRTVSWPGIESAIKTRCSVVMTTKHDNVMMIMILIMVKCLLL